MIQHLLYSLLPILLSLLLGWGLGKIIAKPLKNRLVSLISVLVWLLLIAIGYQFAHILFDPALGVQIMVEAFIYASVISLVTFALLLQGHTTQTKQSRSLQQILTPIRECLTAVAMVGVGMLIYAIWPYASQSEQISAGLLYLLIVLVGIDLAGIQLAGLTGQHWKVPIVVLLATLLAAGLSSWILPRDFIELLVLGSGFGWFSLSGPLVGKLLGPEQGTFALLTDLMREFYSILLLYLLGKRYPSSVIGVCGATAMDSTLPFIKNNCSSLNVQIAIFSGFILTVLAPVFIILFVSFVPL